MQLHFDEGELDGQLQRSFVKAEQGMANPGECMAIAREVDEGDFDSWLPAFSGFAAGLRDRASQAERAGHRLSARGGYLRACEYFRNAFFFRRGELDDARLQDCYGASVECFRAAMPLLDHPIEAVELEAPDGPNTGYLATPAGASGPLPTVILPGGYESTAEEAYPVVAEAVARGYAILVFDGPGQGATLYERRVVMRPDWEAVLPPVVDQLLARPEVDRDRLALLGRSFGGYLAPRSASGEPRLAALIADPGQYDLGAAIRGRLPNQLVDQLDSDSDEARVAFEGLLEIDRLRRMFAPRMATHGCTTVQGYVREMLRYTNEGSAEWIACPTLVCDNEADPVSTGQGEALYERLRCPKTFVRFGAAEGAEGHCEGLGAKIFFERAFDWLDETLAARS